MSEAVQIKGDSVVIPSPETAADRKIFAFFAQKVFPKLGIRKSLRFLLLAHLNAKIFVQWLDFLNRDLPAEIPDSTRLRLAQRIVRPYMRPRFDVAARTDLLISHYTSLRRHFPASTIYSILQERPVTLATLTGKSARSHRITMGIETTKEGEICFSFIDGAAALAQLRGTLGVDAEQRPVFWIGGLQGAKPPQGRDEIVSATRDLNGLRPKHAVLQAACSFAQWCEVGRMIAPDSNHHVSQRGWGKWSPKRKIHADYNAFWEEVGGTRMNDGDYCIALPLPRRDPSEILSKRRKEWLNRYKQIDVIADGTVAALNRLGNIINTSPPETHG